MDEASLFAAALDKADPAARQAFLDEACAGDAGLRQRLEKLLAADEHAFRILDDGKNAAAVLGAYRPEPPLAAEQPFAGRFTLLLKLGEGGMGEVWVADQHEPVRRKVAVKVVRPGLCSPGHLTRFEAERQALALMNHPNIARVLDAGVVSGRPFFVMELVEGVPLTKYCDEARLTLRQRLDLFLPVCEAVQHAHQKGIIHRDIKPSNILVALLDGKSVPKVIDFGVAKATGPRLPEAIVSTEVGTLVGTPEYMSPEQAELNNRDIDTRSDVYSLGVVLYELLAGSVPFTREQLQAVPFDEMLRIIKEVEPLRPSRRLADAENSPSVAAAHRTEPKKLTAEVRGELDWIVMKCLEKDPGRRYATATGLAMDLRRYLADEPVLAGPPSRSYRARKFLRRHRGAVLAAGLLTLALVASAVGTTVGWIGAVRARHAEAERVAAERTADKRLAQVEKGIVLLASVFEGLDPNAEEKEGRPLRAILADRLDQAAAELEGEAVGDPLVVARLQNRLGQTYLSLGHHEKAAALFAKVVATSRAELGPEHATTLRAARNLALAHRNAGRPTEAIALYEEVRDIQKRTLGGDDPETWETLHALGVAYWKAWRIADAVALLEKVRAYRDRTYAPDHTRTFGLLSDLAGAYSAGGNHDAAIALLEKVLDDRVKRYGEAHVFALTCLNNLANAYRVGNRIRRAVVLYEKGRDVAVPKLGPYHPLTLAILDSLAEVYRVSGRTADAIALHEQVRERRTLLYGGRHPLTLLTTYALGLAYKAAKKPETALPLLQQAVAGYERLAFAHVETETAIDALCTCHEHLNQYDQAEAWRRKWLPVTKAKDGPQSINYGEALAGLGANLFRQQKHADAEPLLRESLAIIEKKKPEEWEAYRIQSLLGAVLLEQRKYAAAEPALVRACQGMAGWADRLGPSHGPFTRKPLTEALERLVRVYEGLGKPAEAARWRKELEATKPGQSR